MPRGSEAPPPPSIDALVATFGLDGTGAEVVRTASRHVVRFPASRVRTFAVPAGTSGPRDEAATARLLAQAGVPAARWQGGPVVVGGWSVSAWQEIPGVDSHVAPVEAVTVGAMAARLHDATAELGARTITPPLLADASTPAPDPAPTLGPCDPEPPLARPIGAALDQVDQAVRAGATGPEDQEVLRVEAERLVPFWAAAAAEAHRSPETDGGSAADVRGEGGVGADGGEARLSEGAVIHGDLHPGNIVVGTAGPILVDLELAGWGPRAYDAAPTVALVRWYGQPEADIASFDRAYGAPLCERAARLHLDEVWALWATAWAVANRHRSPEAEAEAALRLATLAGAQPARPWRLR